MPRRVGPGASRRAPPRVGGRAPGGRRQLYSRACAWPHGPGFPRLAKWIRTRAPAVCSDPQGFPRHAVQNTPAAGAGPARWWIRVASGAGPRGRRRPRPVRRPTRRQPDEAPPEQCRVGPRPSCGGLGRHGLRTGSVGRAAHASILPSGDPHVDPVLRRGVVPDHVLAPVAVHVGEVHRELVPVGGDRVELVGR